MRVTLLAALGAGVILGSLSMGCSREPQNKSGGEQIVQRGNEREVDAKPEKVTDGDEVGLIGDWK